MDKKKVLTWFDVVERAKMIDNHLCDVTWKQLNRGTAIIWKRKEKKGERK